ncbi:MAG: hypothetical protein HGA19_21245 [Oscillochloris sp.]|nr:hypothetical protein [Oscillochloris sp.]
MSRNYFEDMYHAQEREAEWRMLNSALRQRREHAFRRSFMATIFWVFGIR